MPNELTVFLAFSIVIWQKCCGLLFGPSCVCIYLSCSEARVILRCGQCRQWQWCWNSVVSF